MTSLRIQFGPFLLDPHTHELWKHGVRLKLARQPFEILVILLDRPGQLVTREELRDQLWQADTFVDFDHSLNAAINKLREVLSDSADAPSYIETLPRRGYRFIAAASNSLMQAPKMEAFHDQVLANPSSSSPVVPSPTSLPSPIQSPNGPSFHLPVILAAVVALLLPTTLLLKRVNSSTTQPAPTALPHIHPLTTLTDETSQPAFSSSGEFIALHREATTPASAGIFVQSLITGASSQLTNNPDDGWPAWSPDGRAIVFARYSENTISLHLISFSADQLATHIAQPEQTLNTTVAPPIHPELTYSPDGHSLIYSATSGLVSFSLQSFATHQLTQAPPSTQDWGASFSPDSRQLLFVRSGDVDFSDQLLTIPAGGGEPMQIATEHARILGAPQWSADGQSIIFASGRGSHPGLWRVSARLRETPVQINDSGWYPSVSHSTPRLAYQRVTRALNIWELDLSGTSPSPRIIIPSTSETDQGPAPQLSPDKTKVAFMSDRSGTMEIWVAHRDGSKARQLTVIGAVGTPRWSPDSNSLAFDVNRRNGAAIYTVGIDGTPPRLLTPDEFQNVCPSWSRDGKWVYFASWRTGTSQVWKVPAAGGTPTQVTYHGGHAAFASLDGERIYYAKSWYANPEIWQVPVNGGRESLVSPQLRPASWASWSVTERGIVFATSSGKGKPSAALYDPVTRRVTTLATLNIVPFWFSASLDGHSLLFDQPGWQQAQIMLVDNFR